MCTINVLTVAAQPALAVLSVTWTPETTCPEKQTSSLVLVNGSLYQHQGLCLIFQRAERKELGSILHHRCFTMVSYCTQAVELPFCCLSDAAGQHTRFVSAALKRKGKGSDVEEADMDAVVHAHNSKRSQCLA